MSRLERRKHALLTQFAVLVFFSLALTHCSGGASQAPPPPPPPPVAAGLGGSNYAVAPPLLFSNYHAQNF